MAAAINGYYTTFVTNLRDVLGDFDASDPGRMGAMVDIIERSGEIYASAQSTGSPADRMYLEQEMLPMLKFARSMLSSIDPSFSGSSGGAAAGKGAAASSGGRFLLKESHDGSQIAKPERYFGALAAAAGVPESRVIQYNVLEAGFSGRVPVRGEGDCLLRSALVSLLLQGKFEVLDRFLEDFQDTVTTRHATGVHDAMELTPSRDGMYHSVSITPDYVANVRRMLCEVSSEGGMSLGEVFYAREHEIDTAFCNCMRSALICKIQDRSFKPEYLSVELRAELAQQAKERKCYLGSIHEAALAELLGIRLEKVVVGTGHAFRDFSAGNNDHFGIQTQILGSPESPDVVSVFFSSEHYDVLVNSSGAPTLDVIALMSTMQHLEEEVTRGTDPEQVTRVLERAYALAPITKEVESAPAQLTTVLRARRIIDAMRTHAENRFGCTLDVKEQASVFVGRFVPTLESDAPQATHVAPLDGNVAAERALHRFYSYKTGADALALLHELNVFFSHDVKGELERKMGREISSDEEIECTSFLLEVLEVLQAGFDGDAEKQEKLGSCFGSIWRNLGRESDRGEGVEFGPNHLFDSPYYFGLALS